MKWLTGFFVIAFAFVSGQAGAAPALEITDGVETLVLDRKELEALPQTTIRTVSPYFVGKTEFSGPTLQHVVEHFGASGATNITLTALNDYSVAGGFDEVLSMDAVVATRRNGDTMTVRQRGPFWVILPLSDRPDLDNQSYHQFMVWQLNRIELTR